MRSSGTSELNPAPNTCFDKATTSFSVKKVVEKQKVFARSIPPPSNPRGDTVYKKFLRHEALALQDA